MRQAFSCITGIHPRRLRYLSPDSYPTGNAFWQAWRALAQEHGWTLRRLFNHEDEALDVCRGPWPVKDDELWIAGAPSFLHRGELHAVVMRGQQLYYDCSVAPRKRRPTRIESGWRVSR